MAAKLLSSSLSDCNEREAAECGGDGDRSIGKDTMELLEKGPLVWGGLFIRVAEVVVVVVLVDGDVVDDDGEANNDDVEVVVADLA